MGGRWPYDLEGGTTIVTFLMVFLIRNTQDRDSAALHVKLDAVMRELQVRNAELYGADEEGEKEGEKELEEQRHLFEKEAQSSRAELSRASPCA